MLWQAWAFTLLCIWLNKSARKWKYVFCCWVLYIWWRVKYSIWNMQRSWGDHGGRRCFFRERKLHICIKQEKKNIRKFVVISSFFFCLSFYVAEMEKLLHAFNSKVFMANYFIYEDYHKHTKKSIFALKCKATSLPKKFILLTASWFDVAAENLVQKYNSYLGRVGYY